MRVMLCGPISHWWGNETAERDRYVAWRDTVTDALVAGGHLVYRPHEAFKGSWDGNDGDACAQLVNDAAMLACHVVFCLTPTGVPSEGTETEIRLCQERGKAVLATPPPMWPETDVDKAVDREALRWYISCAALNLVEAR